jgi:hypothetical protein
VFEVQVEANPLEAQIWIMCIPQEEKVISAVFVGEFIVARVTAPSLIINCFVILLSTQLYPQDAPQSPAPVYVHVIVAEAAAAEQSFCTTLIPAGASCGA